MAFRRRSYRANRSTVRRAINALRGRFRRMRRMRRPGRGGYRL